MTKEDKQKAMEMLSEAYDAQWTLLNYIDPRLREYIYDVATFEESHNAYEVLGAVKFLRLLRTYELDIDTFKDVVYKYEGVWVRDDGVWHHVEGGLKHPGTTGPTYYRLQPFQVFVLASMFVLRAWIDTETYAGTRELLDTERVEYGKIYDLRRLCTEFTDYTPRKTAKTQLSAFIQFWYFMSGDENAECFCCANASDQAKILFSRTRELIHQMDPRERRIRFTASQVNWKPGQFRTASLTALSAGGKTKDGLFAQLCSADEFGSAAYVNGASDMGKLVSVVESSMGPRREPMTFISTTAGIIQAGPFIDKLAGIKQLLMNELDPDYPHDLSTDRQMCLLLEPDEWEQSDEELLLTSKAVRKKVNPMLGVIVQHSFYEDEIAKARQNPEKMNEVISKLLNVYRIGNVSEWIKPQDIRKLQVERRIDDCKASEGWVVLCGMDFSKGDDLHAVTYLAVRVNPETKATEFFADLDAWVTERALQESTIRTLYEKWQAEGWLHVCPGAVLQPSLPVNRIVDLIEHQGVSFIRWGYDSYQSRDPINTLKAYLWDNKGVNPDVYVVPVSQTYASYNPAVLRIEACVWSDPPLIAFSNSPLWPWEFSNTVIDEDIRMSNRKPIKRSQADSCKVDNVQCLATCFILLDQIDGTLQPTPSPSRGEWS